MVSARVRPGMSAFAIGGQLSKAKAAKAAAK
jgi:hypothetical protein